MSPRPASPARSGRAWDSTPTRRLRPGLLVTLALLALVPAVLATAIRLAEPTEDGWALLASFVPYGALGYPLALVLLLVALVRARRRGPLAALALVAAALTALHVAWMLPLFVPDDRPVTGPSFVVLEQNAYLGQVDVGALGEAASGADVVVLTESTRELLSRLQTPAWDARFPYGVGDLLGPVSDTTVFSRFPLTAVAAVPGTGSTTWTMSVEVPGRAPVRLVAAHPCNPYCGNGLFAREHAVVRQAVLANLGRPLVLAGDLNATDDHAPLLLLRRDGLRDATDLVGAGWVPTWPADHAYPPLLPIDHVLVDDQLTATSLRTVHLPGTDHLGLLVTLRGTT